MVRPTASPIVHQTSVRARRLEAFIGSLHTETDKVARNYVNQNPQAVQVSTIVADTSTGSADYVFVFNGVTYTMTEDGTTTGVNDIATQLGAFCQNEGAINGHVVVTVVTDTVTLTGRLPGYSFTITDADAKITTATGTTAADAAAVTFGRALFKTGFNANATPFFSVEDTIENAALVLASSFTAQVDTWTVADPGTGNIISATLTIVGVDEVIALGVAWDTALDGTLDDLAAVLNAALVDIGADTYVTVAGPAGAPSAGELEFTAAIAGVDFTSMVACDDDAGYPAITVATNKALTTSLHLAFAGMALRVSDDEADLDFETNTTGAYAANSTMVAIERGEVWVDNSDTITSTDPVFIDTDAATGTFHNAAAAGRIPLARDRAEWVKNGRSIDGETIAILRLK